jgi:tetratricopeptide (TPR) repeat protein
MRVTLVCLSIALALTAAAQSDVGEVAFANSGAPEAQAAFARGMGLLHDFEYPPAAESFRKAQELDPSFAMAYWGEAMTYTHPIWFQQDVEAARAVLRRLGATPADRLAKAPTERERDYLRSVEVLYGEGSKNERDFRFADAMAALHAKYPDDVDATAFYALALLGTAHEGRDFATYMHAAALLEEVFPKHMRHPGVLHYLIHSYDDPIHAPLGLRAARLYGEVAPSAGHALHMTSHIFVAMGMWDDVIDANRRAIDVVNRQREAKGKQPGDCGHYPTWLHYGLLQKGDLAGARKALDACRVSAFEVTYESAGPADSLEGRVDGFAEMLAHQVASGVALTAADTVAIPEGAKFDRARMTMAYADVLAAAKRGDVTALKAAVARVHVQPKTTTATARAPENPSGRIRAEVMGQEADALLLLAGGKSAEAIALLEAAAQAEKAMPFEFGPPVVPKPAAELLADTLLAAGRAGDAAKWYRLALERTPGRTPAREGLGRAGKAGATKTSAAEFNSSQAGCGHHHQ